VCSFCIRRVPDVSPARSDEVSFLNFSSTNDQTCVDSYVVVHTDMFWCGLRNDNTIAASERKGVRMATVATHFDVREG
jgi:hypothetical protein